MINIKKGNTYNKNMVIKTIMCRVKNRNVYR